MTRFILNDKGWFCETLKSLINGNTEFVSEHHNPINIDLIEDWLFVCEEMGLIRLSRRNWKTLDHPVLGTVQWKSGARRTPEKGYFFLRVNGRPILGYDDFSQKSLVSGRASVEWVAEKTRKLSHEKRVTVEDFLDGGDKEDFRPIEEVLRRIPPGSSFRNEDTEDGLSLVEVAIIYRDAISAEIKKGYLWVVLGGKWGRESKKTFYKLIPQ